MRVKREYDDDPFLDPEAKMNLSEYIRLINSKVFSSLNKRFPKEADLKLNQYKQIRFMRSKLVTTVDTKGCLHTPLIINYKHRMIPSIANLQLQVLISLILSPQTKDEMTVQAFEKLFEDALKDNKQEGLSFEYLRTKKEEDIDLLIKQVGFHKRKAKAIRNLGLLENEIPLEYETLVALDGVGPKIAMLALQNAVGKVVGIGVDTHVNRFASKFEWIKHNNGRKPLKNAEITRKLLEENNVPRDVWAEFNLMLVGFGQDICTSNKIPKCDICLVKNCKDRRTKIDPSLDIVQDIEDLDIGFDSKHSKQWLELCESKYNLTIRNEGILGDWDVKFSQLSQELNGVPLLFEESELKNTKKAKIEIKVEQEDFKAV